MKTFYPQTTNKIIHKGKAGNIYKLDGIQKCVSIAKALKEDSNYTVEDVSVNIEKIQEATTLINSVHSQEIIEAYKTGQPESLANASGVMWQPDLYTYVLESALVAKLAVEESIKQGISLAITGGGHHAEITKPFGFCTINTMAIAATVATTLGKKVAIIDLDTHYSNGCFDILHTNPNVTVYSIWNQTLDKWKYYEHNNNNIWHQKAKDVEDYFIKLNLLIEHITKNRPDIVIYHLGLDVLNTDRMGGVKGMTEENILKRDSLIKQLLTDLKTPVTIFLGGAYIDWSKGTEYAMQQKQSLTNLQHKIIDLYRI